MYNTALKLGKLQAEFKIQVDPEEYARENLKFGLVEVVYEWAKVLPSVYLSSLPPPALVNLSWACRIIFC